MEEYEVVRLTPKRNKKIEEWKSFQFETRCRSQQFFRCAETENDKKRLWKSKSKKIFRKALRIRKIACSASIQIGVHEGLEVLNGDIKMIDAISQKRAKGLLEDIMFDIAGFGQVFPTGSCLILIVQELDIYPPR